MFDQFMPRKLCLLLYHKLFVIVYTKSAGRGRLGLQRAAHRAALVAWFPCNYRSAACCAASRATFVRVIPA